MCRRCPSECSVIYTYGTETCSVQMQFFPFQVQTPKHIFGVTNNSCDFLSPSTRAKSLSMTLDQSVSCQTIQFRVFSSRSEIIRSQKAKISTRLAHVIRPHLGHFSILAIADQTQSSPINLVAFPTSISKMEAHPPLFLLLCTTQHTTRQHDTKLY